MKVRFKLGAEVHEVVPARRGDGAEIRIGGRTRQASLRRFGDGEAVVTLDGRPMRVWIAQRGDEIFIHAGGRAWHLTAVDDVDAAHGHGAAEDAVIAPMPGTVVDVPVAAGDAVKRGAVLIVIESMKLETAIKAPRDGVVASVPLGKGATFDRDALLVALEPESP